MLHGDPTMHLENGTSHSQNLGGKKSERKHEEKTKEDGITKHDKEKKDSERGGF